MTQVSPSALSLLRMSGTANIRKMFSVALYQLHRDGRTEKYCRALIPKRPLRTTPLTNVFLFLG